MQNNPIRSMGKISTVLVHLCMRICCVHKTTIKTNERTNELNVDVQTRANINRAMRKKSVQTGRSHVGN